MKRLRISVFRSNKYIYAQIIDDKNQKTLVSASDLSFVSKQNKQKNSKKSLLKIDRAKKVGEELAKKALKKGIKKVWFDRGKYKYHGRIKVLAEALRSGGLDF